MWQRSMVISAAIFGGYFVLSTADPGLHRPAHHRSRLDRP
jgi:hypothetical protein